MTADDQTLRIVTWNCHHGRLDERANEVRSKLDADLIVLQECSRPPDEGAAWFETRCGKGVGVVGSNDLTVEPCAPAILAGGSAFPVRVRGRLSFNVLAVWAFPEPTYPRAVLQAFDLYEDFLDKRSSIVIGDFNSHPRFDRGRRVGHMALVEGLRERFGLVSAYHAFVGEECGFELRPTRYWGSREKSFHIDYCFIPEAWVSSLRDVEIAPFEEWGSSDHRPVTVELVLRSRIAHILDPEYRP